MTNPTRTPRSTTSGWSFACAAGLQLPALIYAAHQFLFESYLKIVPLVVDDGYYYLSVARNIWKYHWFTYDGLNLCYGFQPLWQLLLIPFATPALSTGQMLRLVLLAALLLYMLTGALIYLTVRRWAGPFGAGVAWTAWTYNLAVSKAYVADIKENVLLAPLLLLTLLVLTSQVKARTRSLLVGVLLGCVWMTRYNAILFSVIVMAAMLPPVAGRRLGVSWRSWVECGGIFMGTSALWYGYAWAAFGSLMPYSGEVKLHATQVHVTEVLGYSWHSWSHASLAFHCLLGAYRVLWGWWFSSLTSVVLLPLAAFLLPFALTRREGGGRMWQPGRDWINMLILLVYALLNSISNSFMLTGEAILANDSYVYSTWYFVGESILPLLLCALVVDRAFSVAAGHRVRAAVGFSLSGVVLLATTWAAASSEAPEVRDPRLFGVLVSVLLVLGASLHRVGAQSPRLKASLRVAATSLVATALIWQHYYSHPGFWLGGARGVHDNESQHFQTALMLREKLAPDTVIASSDTGVFGYFLERPVINMEGLVNSREYFSLYLRREGLAEDFRAKGVQYVHGYSSRIQDGRWAHIHLADFPFDYRPVWRPGLEGADAESAQYRFLMYVPEWVEEPAHSFPEFGETFLGDKWVSLPRYIGRDGRVRGESGSDGIALNFEGAKAEGWSTADTQPSRDARETPGGEGEYCLRSGDAETVRFVSSRFKLRNTLLRMRLAGNPDPKRLVFRLVADEGILAELSGEGTNRFIERAVDLSEYVGRTVWMELIDRSTDGHLAVDDIRFIPVIP